MEISRFRIVVATLLIVVGYVSDAAAQQATWPKTSDLAVDGGAGVNYEPSDTYAQWHVANFGVDCCPYFLAAGSYSCQFTIRTLDGTVESKVFALLATPFEEGQVLPKSNTTIFLTGPSQHTVTLTGECFYYVSNRLMGGRNFTTSYILVVEKPTSVPKITAPQLKR